MIFAAVNTNVSLALGVIVALVGSGGVIFGALRFNREEAGKTVSQQAQILEGMRGLNDELCEALARARKERDEWHVEATELRAAADGLRAEVALLRLEVARLNEKLGESS